MAPVCPSLKPRKGMVVATIALAATVFTVSGSIQMRLANGFRTVQMYSGRLEVFDSITGTWGTVCDDSFNDLSATVLCGILAFSFGKSVPSAIFGAGNGSISLDEVFCTGGETDIAQCFNNGWGVSDCQHTEDIGLVCFKPQENSSEKVNGTNIRLANGKAYSYSLNGRLEVFYNNTWGTVCDDAYNSRTGQVICKLLGLSSAYSVRQNNDPATNGQIWLDQLVCSGRETDISECSHNNWGVNDCSHREDIGLTCVEPQLSDYLTCTTSDCNMVEENRAETRGTTGQSAGCCGNLPCPAAGPGLSTDILLAGGFGNNFSIGGRLEVSHDGTWGTVCDDSFTQSTAIVICNSLGYSSGDTVAISRCGIGNGPIWLDEVVCSGGEDDISKCSHNNWGVHDCTHSKDVGLVCWKTPGNHLRLVGGRPDASGLTGRLELFHNDAWRIVCYDNFTPNTTRVICNLLGFSGGRLFRTYYTGKTGLYVIISIQCAGDETDVWQCSIRQSGTHPCARNEAASLQCAFHMSNPITYTSTKSQDIHVTGTSSAAKETLAATSLSVKTAGTIQTSNAIQGYAVWWWETPPTAQTPGAVKEAFDYQTTIIGMAVGLGVLVVVIVVVTVVFVFRLRRLSQGAGNAESSVSRENPPSQIPSTQEDSSYENAVIVAQSRRRIREGLEIAQETEIPALHPYSGSNARHDSVSRSSMYQNVGYRHDPSTENIYMTIK